MIVLQMEKEKVKKKVKGMKILIEILIKNLKVLV
jgi:hypothetical protein